MSEKTEKTAGELLKEQLFYKADSVYVKDKGIQGTIFEYCEEYRKFINTVKTERIAVETSVAIAKENGYVEYSRGMKLKTGDKIYYINRERAVIFAKIGRSPLDKGLNIAVSHIDAPRIDLKSKPIYEDGKMALLKTHYYGGIKKYQWMSIPLAMHGTIIKKDGSKIKIVIGEDINDPVFCINDLLPHLAREQMAKTMTEAINGEGLNVLCGSIPFDNDDKPEFIKLNVLKLLNDKYGIDETDLISADISLVPAMPARDVGFDRSFIGAYGQDDRVCAYTSLTALMDSKEVDRTALCILADKEETGSDGNTGTNSRYILSFIEELCDVFNAKLRDVLKSSVCFSADVNVTYDPNYPDVLDKRNCAYANSGLVVTKYTGSRGKSDTSEASCEFMGYVRNLLDTNGVAWQTGNLGKVDIGGGGTVAKYIAFLDIDVVDVGVPILAMHSPFEVAAKADIYMAYRGFCALFK